MKKILTVAFIGLGLFAKAQMTLAPGEAAPDFNLKNVDDKTVSFKNYPDAKGYIVVFTCNTCPYAMAYEKRIIELNEKYAPLGFPVIAINPNDPAAQPADSREKMKARAASKKYSFPYLFDDGQKITDQYGAKATPHTFVIARTGRGNVIKYTGAIDNDTEDTDPEKIKYVEAVIASLMKNEQPAYSVTKAIGCTVKRVKKG